MNIIIIGKGTNYQQIPQKKKGMMKPGIYKYENQLSALEKKAIKESPEGEKLESFINEIKNMAPPENPSEEPSLNR